MVFFYKKIIKNKIDMNTNTQTKREPKGSTSSCLRLLHTAAIMVVMTVGMFMPQGAWAADESELNKVYLEDKSYYVISSNDDWLKFRELVKKAAGAKEVNAILDADITVSEPVGLSNWPYRGTFHGNGHTVTLNIDWGNEDYAAMFPIVKDVTVRDVYIEGNVKGGQHTATIVGLALGKPTITIERVRVHTSVTTTKQYAGGFVGHCGNADVFVNDGMSYGYIYSSGSGEKIAGSIIG
jgi:hypothetical protein